MKSDDGRLANAATPPGAVTSLDVQLPEGVPAPTGTPSNRGTMDWKNVRTCVCHSTKLFSYTDADRVVHIRCLDCGRQVRGKTAFSCLKHWNGGRTARRRKPERPAIIFGRRKLKGGPTRLSSRPSSQG